MKHFYKDAITGKPIRRREPQGNDRDRIFRELAYVFRSQRERIVNGWKKKN